MTISTKNCWQPRKTTIAFLVSAAIASSEACAFQLETGVDEWSASLENLVEYNAMYRTSKTERIYQDGQNIFANANDGSEYYARGLVSNEYKLTSEFHLHAGEDDGLFMRGSAWYDSQLLDHNPTGGDNPLHNTDSDQRYPSDLENRSGHNARLLDAYLYSNRYLGEMPVSLRLGRQVINWGEGIYYAEGLNVVNPVDVGRLVLPNASLKEALLPTNMLSLQLGLNDSLSFESFYGLEWKGNELMPTGAFLGNEDIFGKGSNGVLLDLRSQLAELGIPDTLVPGLNGVDGVVAGARYGHEEEARDSGQYGFALRYMAQELNNTEFSLYYLNYHSKVAFLSLHKGSSFGCSAGSGGRFADLCGLTKAAAPEAVPLVDGLDLLDSTRYDLIYPENIHLYGFTVSGNLGDTNLALELTYRPNAPLEPSMSYELEQLASGALLGGASGLPIDLGEFGETSALDGRDSIDLYRRHELYTGSLSAIHSFGPAIGLDSLFLVAELAANHEPGSLLNTPNYDYLSPFSWGYTLNLSGSYENALPGIDLLPGLTFRQDVYGTSPALNENFIEGRKSANLELGAKYGENLTGKLSYTSFWGARKDNPLIDRDNLALNLSYSF